MVHCCGSCSCSWLWRWTALVFLEGERGLWMWSGYTTGFFNALIFMGQTVAQTDRAEQNETKQEAAFPARQMSEWAGE